MRLQIPKVEIGASSFLADELGVEIVGQDVSNFAPLVYV